jgi:hypothetical protein
MVLLKTLRSVVGDGVDMEVKFWTEWREFCKFFLREDIFERSELFWDDFFKGSSLSFQGAF